MCYSATASFTLGSVLIASGIFSVVTAYKTNKNYLFFAFIPMLLGLQQGIEGIIWENLHAANSSAVHFFTYIYLFIAFYFWPAYVPICVYFTEQDTLRKKILMGLLIAGQILGLIFYTPLLFNVIPITTYVIKHSIHYATYQTNALIWTYSIIYMGILTAALLVSSSTAIRFFGLMLLLASMVSYYLYLYVFTSLWCFFAAILSIYIAYMIYRLPSKQLYTQDATAKT